MYTYKCRECETEITVSSRLEGMDTTHVDAVGSLKSECSGLLYRLFKPPTVVFRGEGFTQQRIVNK